MKFTFKNFGYIDQGSVELADLTLICGPNNVGKTYISYAIYGFFKHFLQYTNLQISKSETSELFEKGSLAVDLNNFESQLKDCLKVSGETFSSLLSSFFNSPDDFFKDAQIAFSLDEVKPNFKVHTKSGVNFGKKENVMRFDKSEDSSILNILLQTKNNQQLPQEIIRDIISERIAWHLFSSSLFEPFAITSERTGIALFYKELDINKYAILEQLSALEKQKNFDPFQLLSSMRSRYAEPIKDNIDIIRDYEQLNKRKSFLSKRKDLYKPIFDELQALIGGSFKFTNGQVFYRPKKERNRNEVLVPVYLSSSSVKSLFLIDFYVNCLAEEKGLLIIDEPELNLHPDNQRRMSSLLARLVNAGIKIIITTHSDFLVREINNRIMLNNNLDNKEELMKRNKLLNEDTLRPKQVSAYTLGVKHRIEKIKVDKYGIDLSIFDELIADSNQMADDIYYSIQES